MIKYAGIFQMEIEGCPGKALCVDTDEMQELSDAIADAGYKGIAFEVLHVRGIVDAPAQQQRLEVNQKWLAEALEILAE